MPRVYWDFREILGLYPVADILCNPICWHTARNARIRGGRAYETKIQVRHVANTAAILDKMNRTARLSHCSEFLEDLAFHAFCKASQNDLSTVRGDLVQHWRRRMLEYSTEMCQGSGFKDGKENQETNDSCVVVGPVSSVKQYGTHLLM